MSSLASPSPVPAARSLLHRGRVASASTSSFASASLSCASDVSMTASELSGYGFESSDDEAGVFFGAHRPIERKIVKALSRSKSSSPSRSNAATAAATAAPAAVRERSTAGEPSTPSRVPSSSSGPRRSSLANRVRKRDSREFLRRKTLLLPCSPEKAQAEKIWEGGVFEKSPSAEAANVGGVSPTGTADGSPVRPRPDSIVVELSSLQLGFSEPASPADVGELEQRPQLPSGDDDEEHDLTDKENAIVPEPYYSEDDEENVPAVEGPTITMGFAPGDANDISTQLDLGGLSLLDLDDPEMGPLDSPTSHSFGVDLGETSDSASTTSDGPDSSCSVSDSLNVSAIGSRILVSGPFVDLPLPIPAGPSDGSPDVPEPALSAPCTPAKPPAVESTSSSDADASFDSDMASPIARGPVILPAFAMRSPVSRTRTPVRGLAATFPDDFPLPQFSVDEAFTLPSLESPRASSTATPRHRISHLQPLTTPASVRVGTSTPGRPLRPIDLGERPLKVLKSVQAGGKPSENDRRVERAKERAQRIGGALDALYASKLAPSASRPAPVTADNTHRQRPGGDASSAPSRSAALSPKKAVVCGVGKVPLTRESQPLKSAMKQPTALPTPKKTVTVAPASRLPAPVAKSKPNGLPRPVSAARRPMALPQVSVAAAAAAPEPAVSVAPPQPAPRTEVKSVLHRSAIATPIIGSKRPFSATQATSVPPRPAGTRSLLGLPSRKVSGASGSGVVKSVSNSPFALGGTHAAAGGPLSLPAARSPAPPQHHQHHHPIARSPAHLGSALGKPARGVGMTPTSHKLGTPSRVAGSGTPLKSAPVRPALYPSHSHSRPSLVKEHPEHEADTARSVPVSALNDGGNGSAPADSAGEAPSSSGAANGSGGAAGNRDCASSGGTNGESAGHGSSSPNGARGNGDGDGPNGPNRNGTPPNAHCDDTSASPKQDAKAENMEVDPAPAPTELPSSSVDLPPSSIELPSSTPPTSSPPDSSLPLEQAACSPVPTEVDDPMTDALPVPPSSSQEPAAAPDTSSTTSRRSKRSIRPPVKLVPTPAAPRTRAAAIESIVPGMSEKELKTATHRNTMRNEVYFCAIDRIIVRKTGARPPSPEPKIRMTADREEEDRKKERDARARRRGRLSGGSGDGESDDGADIEPVVPLVEHIEQHVAPGDDEGGPWQTPVRPKKRPRIDSSEEDSASGAADSEGSRRASHDRFVRWNRALTVIRGGLGELRPNWPVSAAAADSVSSPASSGSSAEATSSPAPKPSQGSSGLRSCLRPGTRVPLDKHGNVLERPIERIKRTKVPITAVFYDGEEPLPVPAYTGVYGATGAGASGSGSGKKGKKA